MRKFFKTLTSVFSHLQAILGTALAASILSMGFLLGASTAQAIVVQDGNVATGITDVTVAGFPLPFNVEFVTSVWSDQNVYDDPPTFDFDNPTDAAAAVDAVNGELNSAGVSLVGESSTAGSPVFTIGFGSFDSVIEGEIVLWLAGAYATPDPDAWISDVAGNPFAGSATDNQVWTWAKSTPVLVPAAVWLFGSGVLGLIGIARRKKAA